MIKHFHFFPGGVFYSQPFRPGAAFAGRDMTDATSPMCLKCNRRLTLRRFRAMLSVAPHSGNEFSILDG